MQEADKANLLEILGRTAADIEVPPRKAGVEIVLDLIPANPLQAMVNAFQGEMVAVMVFSLLIGIAVTLCPRERVQPLISLLQAIYEVVMKVIGLAMKLAPYGVAALRKKVVQPDGALRLRDSSKAGLVRRCRHRRAGPATCLLCTRSF